MALKEDEFELVDDESEDAEELLKLLDDRLLETPITDALALDELLDDEELLEDIALLVDTELVLELLSADETLELDELVLAIEFGCDEVLLPRLPALAGALDEFSTAPPPQAEREIVQINNKVERDNERYCIA